MTKIELTKEEVFDMTECLSLIDHHDLVPTQLIELGNLTIEVVCSECRGTGEISVDEDDGQGHTMRGVGTQKCICKSKPEPDDQENEE